MLGVMAVCTRQGSWLHMAMTVHIYGADQGTVCGEAQCYIYGVNVGCYMSMVRDMAIHGNDCAYAVNVGATWS